MDMPRVRNGECSLKHRLHCVQTTRAGAEDPQGITEATQDL
jgi:hypothetical protein